MSTDARYMFYSKEKQFSRAEERLFARTDLIFNATQDLLVMMEDMDVTKVDLAKKMGKSKSFVTQILGGARNMTLGSLSDICFALGVTPKIKIMSPEQIKAQEEHDRQANIARVKCESLNQEIEKLFKRQQEIVISKNSRRKPSWVTECCNDENFNSIGHMKSGKSDYAASSVSTA